MARNTAHPPRLISIGALSQATGLPVETIRTWERRYGFPSPERTPSGHRRYALDTVERLLLVTQALARGHRPSAIVDAEPEVLRRLLELPEGGATDDLQAPLPTPFGGQVDVVPSWLRHVARLDGDALDRGLRQAWHALGAVRFLDEALGPFLGDVGRQWQSGELSIRHEHFASERIHDFLVSQWRPLSDAARGRRAVCATLPGEQHTLGLHMAAAVLALSGFGIVFLGADTPIEDIAETARDVSPAAVVVSVSAAADAERAADQLQDLRRRIDSTVELVVGGSGAASFDGIARVDNYRALSEWASRGSRV